MALGKKGVFLFQNKIIGGQGLMRIFRGMQKLVREYKTKVSCWDKSFSQGIGVTAPKARKRDKFKARVLFL